MTWFVNTIRVPLLYFLIMFSLFFFFFYRFIDFQADFRIGWNHFILGFAGISHYISWSDLEYALQIYTPIEKFTYSSATVKIYIVDDIDCEIRAVLPDSSMVIILYNIIYMRISVCCVFLCPYGMYFCGCVPMYVYTWASVWVKCLFIVSA